MNYSYQSHDLLMVIWKLITFQLHPKCFNVDKLRKISDLICNSYLNLYKISGQVANILDYYKWSPNFIHNKV